jgi:hypothetical protein
MPVMMLVLRVSFPGDGSLRTYLAVVACLNKWCWRVVYFYFRMSRPAGRPTPAVTFNDMPRDPFPIWRPRLSQASCG